MVSLRSHTRLIWRLKIELLRDVDSIQVQVPNAYALPETDSICPKICTLYGKSPRHSSRNRLLPGCRHCDWNQATCARESIAVAIGVSRTHHVARYYGCRTPIVTIHLSTNSGHAVTGRLVRRKPKEWPPCADRCISNRTPACFSPA